jgi:subtilisin family serine protease
MKNTFLFVLVLVSFMGFAQEDAWVYFTDKPNAQSFFDDPLSELTQRTLDRRAAQGIVLDITDAPLEVSYVAAITAANGIVVKAQSKWMNCLHIRGSLSDINALLSLSFVDHIRYANGSLNAKNASGGTGQPVQKPMEVQTSFSYGNSGNQIQMLNAHLLHEANFTGGSKIIAVLDSGFSGVNTIIPFNRMFSNGLYLGGYNYVARNTDVFSTHNHGTMTLSCMVGYVDGQLVGTAPDARYYIYITEDVNSENPVEESNWVEAAEEADRNGVDVISTSLGYFEYDNPNYSHTYSEMTGDVAFISQGANIAYAKGMIVVASAGNSGSSSNPHIGVPAEATHVLAVGAVQSNRQYASFSSIGPSFDGRVKPNLMAQGQSAVLSNTSGGIVTASGTSFSCPILAGAIASFWQAIPWATNQQVMDLVEQSADRYGNPTAQYGYGIPDFQYALDMAYLQVSTHSDTRFNVFPNPVVEEVHVSYPASFQDATIKMYNTLGQLVVETSISNERDVFSVAGLPTGLYSYVLKSGAFLQQGKLVKK